MATISSVGDMVQYCIDVILKEAKEEIVIDKSIVKRLGINEDNTLFQQQIVEDGILLRIIRKETQL